MKLTEKQFESFKWIDIENPNKEDLDSINKQYNLNYYLIKDSLEKGHLPKYEKTYKIDFFIFRAYTSDVDRIEITHEAFNRKGFALGAVLAAEFVAGKKGIFTMKDLLNL